MAGYSNAILIRFSENLILNNSREKDWNSAHSARGWRETTVNALEFGSEYFTQRGVYFACLNDYGQNGTDGHKTKENTDFSSITAIVLDYDGKDKDQFSSADAIRWMSELDFKVYVVSGASFQQSVKDSYRIMIPLSDPVDMATFSECMNCFISDGKFGKGLDNSCKSFRFWSPSNGKLFHANEGVRLAKVEELIAITDYATRRKLKADDPKTLHEHIQLKKEKALSDKKVEGVENISRIDGFWENYKDLKEDQKVTLCCPFCDPKARKDPSKKNSFISRGPSGLLFLYCSSEARTYWEQIDFEERFKQFFSFSDNVYRIIPLNKTCKIEYSKIGTRKFHILTWTDYTELRNDAFNYLVRERDFGIIPEIKYECSVEFEKFKFELDIPNNQIHVLVPAIHVVIKENHVIEDYLDQTFGEYSDFIKDWITLYSYTNWKRMATLILTGGRGTGKTTFTNLIAAIFKGHSQTPRNAEDRFNTFQEGKLVVIDEAFAKGKGQYTLLKQLSGGESLSVEKKYMPISEVPNNLHIILTSNENFPLFVESEEFIEDVHNNQWFMHKFPEITYRDASYLSKLVDRIGHWLRTEGKIRYERLKGNTFSRYGQEVPITDELRDLFSFSTSPREYKAKTFIKSYLASPFDENKTTLNTRYLEEWCGKNKCDYSFVLKDLKNFGYIESSRKSQESYLGRRFPQYPLTQKAFDLVK